MRSAARKSGRFNEMSASNTPTRVTPGTSCPFVTICVPIRTSISCVRQALSTRSNAPRRLTLSRSSRATRTPGRKVLKASSTCSVPTPHPSSAGSPHCGQQSGACRAKPQ